MRTDPTNFVFCSTGCRSGGKVTTTVNTNATTWRDIIQPDGKIVAIGTSSSLGGAIARYNDDGSLDTSFGTSGVFTDSGNWLIDGAIQSDGKIIAVGGSGGDFFVIRLNSDGTVDTSFGSSGSVQVDFGASEYAMGVALAPDGKIVVTGPTITSGSGDFAVARLTTSGSLDTSFNSTGKETLDLGGNDGPNGVLVQDSGKIVVVGASAGGAYVVRFNAGGGVDTSFGPSGTGKIYQSGDYGFRMSIQALSDTRLLVAGQESGNVILHRYSADGIADSTFGSSGVVTTDLGASDSAFDIGVQPDGKVVVVGQSQSGASNYDAVAIRYNVDGSLDTTFGSGGTMLIWYGSSSYSETDYFESVAIQPDGQTRKTGRVQFKQFWQEATMTTRRSMLKWIPAACLAGWWGLGRRREVQGSGFGVQGSGKTRERSSDDDAQSNASHSGDCARSGVTVTRTFYDEQGRVIAIVQECPDWRPVITHY